jgi:NAD+ synthase (glutamine-hydrolysing)
MSAALCTLAIGKENVIAINMPSKFNSDTTKDLAKESATNL